MNFPLTKHEIIVMSLTDFFDSASRRHNDVIQCQRYPECKG